MARIPAAAFTRSYISRMYVNVFIYILHQHLPIHLQGSNVSYNIYELGYAPVADTRHYRNAYCISLTTHTQKAVHSCCIDTSQSYLESE